MSLIRTGSIEEEPSAAPVDIDRLVVERFPKNITNYMCIEGTVYSLRAVARKDKPLEEIVREIYASRYKSELESLTQSVGRECLDSIQAQVNRIRDCARDSKITIPNELVDNVVVGNQEGVFPVKLVMIKPYLVRGDANSFVPYFTAEFIDSRFPILRSVARDKVLIATVNVPMQPVPMLVKYNTKIQKLFILNGHKTFHTYIGGKLCTGKNTAQDYWNLPIEELGKVLSVLNLFSPASDVIKGDYLDGEGLRDWYKRDILNENTVVSIEEEVVWTTQ